MAKVVLVTGASAGIGKACGDRLHAAGWEVVGTSRRGTGGAGWSGAVMDVDADESVRAGVAAALAAHDRLDAVVLSAGWGVAGAAEHTTIDEAKAQFETNFWGAVRVVQAALPGMRDQRSGRIVIIGSIGGLIGIPFQSFYSASKFALEGFAESLAYEVEPFGIGVTVVEPGNVATDFTASRKMAAAAADDDVYRAALTKAVGVMERDEQNGVPPDLVARCVQKVLEAKRTPRRASVGKAGERVGIAAKRVLPYRWFEAAARSSLGV
jgi:NAD(P)-dependent dehydrogenase (short-subunit alcohol dehydrogenase family)